MDARMSRAVVEVFVRLHEEGLIYRGKRLVNWDPVLGTAVSDLEVDSEEEDGKHLGDPLSAGGRHRQPGGRHHAPGNHAGRRRGGGASRRRALPRTGRQAACSCRSPAARIPVIADDYVDREFGTGCVKITPAHDFNDYAGRPAPSASQLINILTLDAQDRTTRRRAAYRGLDRFEARKRVLADLQAQGLLVSEKPHKLRCRARAAPA